MYVDGNFWQHPNDIYVSLWIVACWIVLRNYTHTATEGKSLFLFTIVSMELLFEAILFQVCIVL